MNINFTLFMQAIAFFAFILFTAKFVWPPLMRAIDTRQRQIAEGIAAGEEGRHSLANAEKRIADMVAEAKSRSSEIIAQGEKLKSETVDAAKTEAKTEAEPHSLVDIQVAVLATVEPGDEPAGPLAQHRMTQARPVDLSPVRVAAQHQVAAVSVETLDGSRIVGEHDPRHRVAQAVKGAIEITDPAPQVLDAGQVNA